MVRRRIVGLLVLMLFVAGCVAGCAALGLKSYQDMTPKEKATMFMQQYNSQYKATMTLAQTPGISEVQKKIVRTKKNVLKAVHPLILEYDFQVTTGVGDPVSEQKIVDMLNTILEKSIN